MWLEGEVNLKRLAAQIPELGWRKPAGLGGTATFQVMFEEGRPVRIANLLLSAGELIKARGAVDLDRTDARIRAVRLERFRFGRSEGSASIHRDPSGTRISFTGPFLDVVEMPKPWGWADGSKNGAPPPGRKPERGPGGGAMPLELRLEAGHLELGPGGRALKQVQAYVRRDGWDWDEAQFSARLAHSGSVVEAVYRPSGNRRDLEVTAGNAGEFCHLFEVLSDVRDGRLRVIAHADREAPAYELRGQIEVQDFAVVNAPFLARLLNALSITGALELLGGEGLIFSRLNGNFIWGNREIILDNLRMSGGALGLTVGGSLDLAASQMALHGTIVPIYEVNALLGHIPLLGDVLSGGEGEGILAATYDMTGSLAAPEISVNPLALLAPGILRSLLFGGGNVDR
jgi:hypothetical protein